MPVSTFPHWIIHQSWAIRRISVWRKKTERCCDDDEMMMINERKSGGAFARRALTIKAATNGMFYGYILLLLLYLHAIMLDCFYFFAHTSVSACIHSLRVRHLREYFLFAVAVCLVKCARRRIELWKRIDCQIRLRCSRVGGRARVCVRREWMRSPTTLPVANVFYNSNASWTSARMPIELNESTDTNETGER